MREITDLPNEILLSIFSYLGTYHVKYVASKVCKRWETLSRDKRLWRKLSFETTTDSTWERTLKFLETTPQLRRIVISHRHTETQVREILNALNRHCGNLTQIDLDATQPIMEHLVSLPKLRNQLECLRLWLIPEQRHKEVFRCLSRFKNLRSVTFVNSDPHLLDFQLFLDDCPQVEELSATKEFSKTNFLTIIAKKKRFRGLSLRIDNLDPNCIRELSTFPNLNRLALMDNNASPEKLLEIGRLPCLESLHLREDASSPVLTSSALTEFFRCGNFDRLKEIKLHKSRLNDEGAAEIRRNCPALTYLEVITYPKSRSGLSEKALVHFLHCKKLESFEITFDSSNEADWIYRRIRHVKHDCDIDEECPIGLDELLLSWDEIQIPID